MIFSNNMVEIVLSSGIPVHVKQIPNALVYKETSRHDLKVPQPPVYTLEDGREVENTMHPAYQDAITIYELQRNNFAFDIILEHAVSFDNRLMNIPAWNNLKKHLKNQKYIQFPSVEEVAFLRFYALGEGFDDKHNLTQNAILHEEPVMRYYKSVLTTRDGYDIHESHIRNAVKTGVDMHQLQVEGCLLVNPVDELNACKEVGLDWSKWFRCEYTLEEKASAVGLYRLNRLVTSHQEDAVQIESEKKAKKK